MRPRRALSFSLAALALAGCAVWMGPISSHPPASARRPMYYSDLGPDTIDVSGYPEEQKRNYEVYARSCSQCHSLARSINAPYVGRSYWEFYILGMRFNTHFRAGAELPKKDIGSILDFLEYDAQVRKVQRREEFDKLTARLKDEFNPLIDQQMKEIFEKMPQRIQQDQTGQR